MPQMTNSQARVADPILTEIARGLQQNQRIGSVILPRVPVGARGGRIITFDRGAFKQYANIRRAPGQNTMRVTFGYAGAPYALEDFRLEGLVPVETAEEAAAVPGIDLAQGAIADVRQIIEDRLEIAQAALITAAGNYPSGNKITLSGTDQWSDGANSDPFKVVEAGKEAIRAKTGKRPNVMWSGAAAFAMLKIHPKIVDRIKYTGMTIADEAMLAALFGVQRFVVGDAITCADDDTVSDVWGKTAGLAYTQTGSIVSRGLPSFGFTYQLSQMPDVEEPYMDRNANSWVFPVRDAVAPVIAGAESGYLISAAVA
jgi:uncharacterized protein YfiM (DUF2279 family)